MNAPKYLEIAQRLRNGYRFRIKGARFDFVYYLTPIEEQNAPQISKKSEFWIINKTLRTTEGSVLKLKYQKMENKFYYINLYPILTAHAEIKTKLMFDDIEFVSGEEGQGNG